MGPTSQDFTGRWAEEETMKRFPRFCGEVIMIPRLPEFQKSLEKVLSGILWVVLSRAGVGQADPFRFLSNSVINLEKEHLVVLSSVSAPFVTLQTLTLSSAWSFLSPKGPAKSF